MNISWNPIRLHPYFNMVSNSSLLLSHLPNTAIMPIGFLKKKLPRPQSQTRPDRFQSKEKHWIHTKPHTPSLIRRRYSKLEQPKGNFKWTPSGSKQNHFVLQQMGPQTKPKQDNIKLDPKLTYKKRLEHMTIKIVPKMRVIRIISLNLKNSRMLSMIIFNSQIRSQIDYAFIPTVSQCQKIAASLQTLQTRALRCIKHFPQKTDTKQFHSLFKTELVKYRAPSTARKFAISWQHHTQPLHQSRADSQPPNINSKKYSKLWPNWNQNSPMILWLTKKVLGNKELIIFKKYQSYYCLYYPTLINTYQTQIIIRYGLHLISSIFTLAQLSRVYGSCRL